jgi:hypothetical protein
LLRLAAFEAARNNFLPNYLSLENLFAGRSSKKKWVQIMNVRFSGLFTGDLRSLIKITGASPHRKWQLRSKSNHPIGRLIIPLNFSLTLGQLRRFDDGDMTIKSNPSEGFYGR